MLSNSLRGVIAAIATPVDGAGAPDHERYVKLARFLLDNGCDGLNVLGTTGEATSFTAEQRMGAMTAIDGIIAANPDKVEQAKAKPTLLGWFVGQVMNATGGKANPQAVNEMLKAKLGIE